MIILHGCITNCTSVRCSTFVGDAHNHDHGYQLLCDSTLSTAINAIHRYEWGEGSMVL